jgi:hypothetical protein
MGAAIWRSTSSIFACTSSTVRQIEGNRFDRRACLVKIQKVRHIHGRPRLSGIDHRQPRRGLVLGYYKAVSAPAAIRAAIKEHKISDPLTQSRLAAQKVQEITEQRP